MSGVSVFIDLPSSMVPSSWAPLKKKIAAEDEMGREKIQ